MLRCKDVLQPAKAAAMQENARNHAFFMFSSSAEIGDR
jgi:hypothetical protein